MKEVIVKLMSGESFSYKKSKWHWYRWIVAVSNREKWVTSTLCTLLTNLE